MIGVTGAAIQRYETGQRRISPELAKRLEFLSDQNLSAAELLGLNSSSIPGRKRDPRETGRPFDGASIEVAIPPDLADMARKYGLDVEALVAEGGVPRLREAFKAAYIVHHKEAIDEINASARAHGTLSQRFGMI
jgi:post-segregation antitoxin (ccd killing protein)